MKTLATSSAAVLIAVFLITQAPISALAYGGGGGGSSAVGAASARKAKTETPAPAPQPQGQVLGASTYVFAKYLAWGSTGQDVVELQKVLIAKGYLNIDAPTGWYGPLTQAAVKQYQIANGIEAVGVVGPITRASLNKASDTVSINEPQSIVGGVVKKAVDTAKSVLAWSAST